uniref:Transcription factor CBF/NF-Y/archaeal histone domain-containing protein n=1 Tax=Arcella intermedia TaxID=1963864 RepID=A0A6B2LNG9_9EUKA
MKAAKLFIIYLTTNANEKCQSLKKGTINANHVFSALEDTELGFLIEELKLIYDEKKLQDEAKKGQKEVTDKELNDSIDTDPDPKDHSDKDPTDTDPGMKDPSMDEEDSQKEEPSD